jgi:hypothetical protein
VSTGLFNWHELMTTDPEAAKPFYRAVVGWDTQPWGTDGAYTLWTSGGQPVGGLMAMPEPVKAAGAPPHSLTYISSPDTDATSREVSARGGKVLKAPWDIPDVGRIAVLADKPAIHRFPAG